MKLVTLLAALALSLPAAAETTAPNLDIANPLTVTIRHSMQQRLSRLVKFLDPGVIGQLKNGDLGVRDNSRLGKLATRQIVEKLIDAENSDRQALIAAIAYAHNRKDAVDEFRRLMAAKWAKEMQSGWWFQDEQGNWIQKP
ncbi:MAG TPA: DUF1318 domain-containing protein [Rhodocyclaceae bacterium]|nr:DUF1318 domain-containing protein [Rhodocyclaceae bacterium]